MLTPVMPPDQQPGQIQLAHELAGRPREGIRAATLAGFLRLSQITFMVAGERSAAERIWAEMGQLAARAHDPAFALMPLVAEAFGAGLDGRLDEALNRAREMVEQAKEIGSPRAGEAFASQVSQRVAMYLGRTQDGAMRGPVRQGLTIPLAQAQSGQRVEAEAGLAPWLERLADPERAKEMWGASLCDGLETMLLLQHLSGVPLVVERLSGVTAVASTPWAVVNAARIRGAGEASLGRADQARASYAQGLEWATKIRHRPEIALTRLQIAELLLAGTPDQQAEAQQHLDFAIEELRTMKMQPALECALRHKGLLHA